MEERKRLRWRRRHRHRAPSRLPRRERPRLRPAHDRAYQHKRRSERKQQRRVLRRELRRLEYFERRLLQFQRRGRDREGFSRKDQEASLKDFNQWVLCTYPLAGAPSGTEDACRVPAGANEWQGTAAEMIKAWYGGNGMPLAMFQDNYVPSGWSGNS